MSREGGAGAPSLGVVLFVALVVLSVAAFALTRAARSADDLVNTVVLSKTVTIGGKAKVDFTLAKPDSSVTVMIIDGRTDLQVRDLADQVALGAGAQTFTWDGLTDGGKPAKGGLFAIRVILGQQGRDILPPGRIRVLIPTPGADAKGGKG